MRTYSTPRRLMRLKNYMIRLKKSLMKAFMRQLLSTPRNLRKNYKVNHSLTHCKFSSLANLQKTIKTRRESYSLKGWGRSAEKIQIRRNFERRFGWSTRKFNREVHAEVTYGLCQGCPYPARRHSSYCLRGLYGQALVPEQHRIALH